MCNGFCEYSVVLWLISITLTTGELFTTTTKMEILIGFEDILIEEAINYVNQEQLRLTEIGKLISHVERERENASKDSRRYLKHPVQSFQLLRRLRRQWKDIKQYISLVKNKNDYLSKVSRFEKSPEYPSDSDYTGAAESLLRLQDIYKLNTSHVADGKITNRQPKSPPLLAEDCFEIGIVALTVSSTSYAQQWMAEALRRFRIGDASYEHYVSENNIVHQLEAAHMKEKLLPEALDYGNKIPQKDPDTVSTALQLTDSYERNSQTLTTGSIPDENERYKALCRDDKDFIKTTWPRRHQRSLHCHLTHHNRPRLYIRPIKEEIINEIPKVVLYHDLLTEPEIRILKQKAEPRLKQAAVRSGAESSSTVSDDRKSSVAWLNLHTLSGAHRIMPRVEDYTDLSTKYGDTEHLQVAHYGIGGFYKYHYDDDHAADSTGYEGKGKRIATLLFYLSDVDEGGATVFTRAGVRVAPSKGSAVFWYNYLKNGERDFSSMHAGCPVLMGTKWVRAKCAMTLVGVPLKFTVREFHTAANLWIREYPQVFRRKCGLSIDD